MQRILVALLFVGLCGHLCAREPALAVIAEDLSGETDSGGLEMVESLAEAGVMESSGVSLSQSSTPRKDPLRTGARI